MTSRFALRLVGLLLFLLGVILTIWMLFRLYADHSLSPGFIGFYTLMASFGLGMAIRGEVLYFPSNDPKRSKPAFRFFILGTILGSQLARAPYKEEFLPLQQQLEYIQEKLGLREPLVTLAEVNAQVKAVTGRAAELEKIRATLNASDPEATKKFNLAVADYNELNRTTAALKAKYEARLAREEQIKAKLVGTLRFKFDDYGLWRDKWTCSGQATYKPDGETLFECTSINDRNERVTFSWSGHWELESDHLRATVQSKSKEVTSDIGYTHEYLIRGITENELHYRDLNDGAERVRYRADL